MQVLRRHSHANEHTDLTDSDSDRDRSAGYVEVVEVCDSTVGQSCQPIENTIRYTLESKMTVEKYFDFAFNFL